MIHAMLVRSFVALCALGLTLHSTAAPLFSTSSTVTSADRTATFDSLTSGAITIGSYTEDLLSLTLLINQSANVGFTPFAPGDFRTTSFYYASGGNISYVDIKGTDGAVFSAIDFLLGDGENPSTTNVRWQTFLNGSLTGSGFYSSVTKGTTVGWTDNSGFDELRVAASSGAGIGSPSPSYLPGFGNFQAIAIDDLRAQVTPIPEPEIYAMMMVGLGVLGWVGRRKKLKEGAAA